ALGNFTSSSSLCHAQHLRSRRQTIHRRCLWRHQTGCSWRRQLCGLLPARLKQSGLYFGVAFYFLTAITIPFAHRCLVTTKSSLTSNVWIKRIAFSLCPSAQLD